MKKRKSHYEVLGVKPEADASEVKRAYRRKAQKAHPDAGGSHEAMAEINSAYECLSDPARRLLYDRTGQDETKPFDEEVRGLLLHVFDAALMAEAPNCLADARRRAKEMKAKIKEKECEALADKKKFADKREKISVKSGANIFHLLIDQQLINIEGALVVLKRQMDVCDAALAELKRYKSTEDAVLAMKLSPLPTYSHIIFNVE